MTEQRPSGSSPATTGTTPTTLTRVYAECTCLYLPTISMRAPLPTLSAALLTLVAVLLLPTRHALASKSVVGMCTDAYETAQRLQNSGNMVAARAAYLRCGAETCPLRLQQECLSTAADIEKAVPTVVFDVVNSKGNQVIQVIVYDGDTQVARAIDGRAIMLDPGPHKFRFETEDGQTAESEVVLLEGQQRRMIRIQLSTGSSSQAPTREQPPTTADTSSPFGAWPWVVVGSGVAVAGVGTGLLINGLSDISDAEALCGGDRSCEGNTAAAYLGNQGNLQRNVGIGMIAGGAGVLAAGLIWELAFNRGQPTPATSTTARTTMSLLLTDACFGVSTSTGF